MLKPLVSKFGPDLPARFIAEKQVRGKLKPIVDRFTLRPSIQFIPTSQPPPPPCHPSAHVGSTFLYRTTANGGRAADRAAAHFIVADARYQTVHRPRRNRNGRYAQMAPLIFERAAAKEHIAMMRLNMGTARQRGSVLGDQRLAESVRC